jgi:stearoyl-CoA desaturase (delta-9 desaturase)
MTAVGAVPGVAATLSPASARLQRNLAIAVIALPLAGVVTGGVLLIRGAVGRAELALFLLMYLLASLGVELGLHRYLSHRAFRAGPRLSALLTVLGSLAAQGPPLFWVAIHRRHHAFSDRSGDPHSPHNQGDARLLRRWWHAHAGWMLHAETTGLSRYVPDLLRDRLLFRIHRQYPYWALTGLLLPGVFLGLATVSWSGFGLGVLWGGLIRKAATDHATWAVNSLGHMVGKQPHRRAGDQSRNIAWLALPSLGGSWHNNHHALPAAARNDHHWWQLDPTGWVVGLLEWCGWIDQVHRASPPLHSRPAEEAK